MLQKAARLVKSPGGFVEEKSLYSQSPKALPDPKRFCESIACFHSLETLWLFLTSKITVSALSGSGDQVT